MKNLIFLFCVISLCSCKGKEECFKENISSIAKWQIKNKTQNPFVYKTDEFYCEIETFIVEEDTIIYFVGNKGADYLNTSVLVSGKERGKITVENKLKVDKDEKWQFKKTKYVVSVFYEEYVKKSGN